MPIVRTGINIRARYRDGSLVASVARIRPEILRFADIDSKLEMVRAFVRESLSVVKLNRRCNRCDIVHRRMILLSNRVVKRHYVSRHDYDAAANVNCTLILCSAK